MKTKNVKYELCVMNFSNTSCLDSKCCVTSLTSFVSSTCNADCRLLCVSTPSTEVPGKSSRDGHRRNFFEATL